MFALVGSYLIVEEVQCPVLLNRVVQVGVVKRQLQNSRRRLQMKGPTILVLHQQTGRLSRRIL